MSDEQNPVITAILTTELTAAQIAELIEKLTSPKILMPPGRYSIDPDWTSYLFEGRVAEEGFRIRRLMRYKNLYPMVEGVHHSIDTGTEIRLTLNDRRERRNAAWLIFGLALPVHATILCGIALGWWSPFTNVGSFIWIIILLLLPFLLYAFFRWHSRRQFRFIVTFLSKALTPRNAVSLDWIPKLIRNRMLLGSAAGEVLIGNRYPRR